MTTTEDERFDELVDIIERFWEFGAQPGSFIESLLSNDLCRTYRNCSRKDRKYIVDLLAHATTRGPGYYPSAEQFKLFLHMGPDARAERLKGWVSRRAHAARIEDRVRGLGVIREVGDGGLEVC